MSIQLIGRHNSYNVQKVLWLLDELKIEFLHTPLGGQPGDTETDDFAKLNPMRKVPVLVDGENVIWESNTILRYLVNQYGHDDWKKLDAYDISIYERWMDWAITRFEPAFVEVFWGYYRTPEAARDMTRVQKGIAACLDCLEKLDRQLQDKNYLLGGRLSLADICTGVFIYRMANVGLEIPLPGNLSNWYARLQQRSAYSKWVMSDFSSLKGRLIY